MGEGLFLPDSKMFLPKFLLILMSIQHTIGLKRTYAAPACSLQQKSVIFPDIQKLEILNAVILYVNCLMLILFLKSCFTRRVNFIIVCSRSGAKLWPHMMSLTYFSQEKRVCFLGTTSFCASTLDAHPAPIHFWILQYRNNMSSRMENRYTRIFDAGWWRLSKSTATLLGLL